MSAGTIKLLIAGALLLHGLGHAGVFVALIVNRLGHNTAPFTAARSWLFPSLPAPAAIAVAGLFYVPATIGFVAAAMSFWGILVPGDLWRQIAVVSAVVSAIGMALFLGNWPTFNTIAALAMNVAVIVTQVWTHWPPQSMFGK
jgi:hypothetical protein